MAGPAATYWKVETVPFPQPGIRLIGHDRIDQFNEWLVERRDDLDRTVSLMNDEYSQLKASARERLGCLFEESDYPSSLVGLFGMSWDFPNVEPPNYLRQLNPKLYEQCQDDSIRLWRWPKPRLWMN